MLYFVVGGGVALLGWVSTNTYVIGAGVVGGLASVLGLMSLARPALSQSDLDRVEIESLKKLADTSEEIKQLERARVATQEQIVSLEEQKRQMAFLVQKASLALFLQEQHRLYEQRILDAIRADKELAGNLSELATIGEKLDALNEEITRDPNVDLLVRIIESARRPTRPTDVSFSDLPPITRAVLLLSRELARTITRITRI
jgi:hypothetical protein